MNPSELLSMCDKRRTIFIMTTSVFHKAEQMVQDARDSGATIPETSFFMGRLFGLKVETYDTVAQCMDRMMKPGPDERLELVTDDIPDDCISHPFMRDQAKKLGERFGFPVGVPNDGH